MFKSILITGGAGFIGSHLVRRMVYRYLNTQFVNLDALTYAGDTSKIKDIASKSNYQFVHGDINDTALVKKLFTQYDFDGLVHLAAESHVDQSIKNPLNFAQTNVMGTLTLLETACRAWDPLDTRPWLGPRGHNSCDLLWGKGGRPPQRRC